jgi:hypothetical protein
MSSPRWTAVVALVVFGGLTAGCGGSGTNGPGTTSATSPAAVPVSMSRTGGIAGVNQSIEIAADGTWVYTNKRNNQSETGTLTAAQRAELQRLVSDPAFSADLGQRAVPKGKPCSDGFQYTIGTTGEKVSFEQCGDGNATVVQAAIALVADATPF